ncbi:MAG: hypothetical protein Q7T19_14710 [Caulobacter sp.]|nr:hypothetical protein [Caulobacter sp.]
MITGPAALPVREPEPDGPTFAVDLIDSTGGGSSKPSLVPSRESAVEALRRRLTAAATDQAPLFDRRASSLSDILGESAGAAEPGPAAPVASRGGNPGDQASIARRLGDPSRPCWRIPARPLPVRMRILLAADGSLAGSPTPIRPAHGTNNAAAERDAMRAMAGCAPYVAAAPGRYRAIDLDFSRRVDIAVPAGFVEVR